MCILFIISSLEVDSLAVALSTKNYFAQMPNRNRLECVAHLRMRCDFLARSIPLKIFTEFWKGLDNMRILIRCYNKVPCFLLDSLYLKIHICFRKSSGLRVNKHSLITSSINQSLCFICKSPNNSEENTGLINRKSKQLIA